MKKLIILLLVLSSFIPHTKAKNDLGMLTKENLWLTIKAMDIMYPEIAFAQAILETGHFKSNNCKEANNLFGMMMPNVRETVAIEKNKRGFAVYETWIHSVQEHRRHCSCHLQSQSHVGQQSTVQGVHQAGQGEGTNLYFTTARAQAAISGTAPISVASGVVSISQSGPSTNGYLSSADWNTFNAKQSALTLGNLTSSDITVTGGTGAVVGSGSTLTLATVNSNVGTFGSSTAIPVITVNGKGLVTAVTTDAVFIPSGALSFIGDVTGTGNTGSNTTLTLATVNSNVGAYGDSVTVPSDKKYILSTKVLDNETGETITFV